ncbi:MAG: hypothetical protein AAF734_07825 [Bacteroidota bacterium]
MLNTIRTAIDAIFTSEPNYLRAIFGDTDTWVPPYEKYSEFSIANPGELLKLIRYTSEISLPPLFFFGDGLKSYFPEVLKPFLFYEEPTLFSSETFIGEHKKEAWFFINGIGSNRDIVELNSRYLSKLFEREIFVLHNPTDSLPVDVLQSLSGKEGDRNQIFTAFATPYLKTALQEKEKVVLIAHSPGTLLASSILDSLITQKSKHLAKLEIYAFANCAEEMSHAPIRNASQRPHIESFSNEHDIIAKMGTLAPYKEARNIKIDGEHFIRKDAWGHFLNAHYLKYLTKESFIHETDKNKKSRLLNYLV